MARYVIDFAPRARAHLRSMSPEVARRILTKVTVLQTDTAPRGDTIKRLAGLEGRVYRLRVGDWRVVFRAQGERVFVLAVVHRGELERELRNLL